MRVKVQYAMLCLAISGLLFGMWGGGATKAVANQAATPDATQATVAPTPDSTHPIKIGMSLSLSGDFSADGKGFQQVWGPIGSSVIASAAFCL